MKISVIVPVYNCEDYLNECLDSILNQTYKNLELILIDDGSKDSSSDICDQYKERDSRVVVVHKENEGVSIARNTGLNLATGEFITFVDSDDYLDSDAYEKMISIMEEYACDICLCDCIKEFADKSQIYSHDIREGFYNFNQLKNEYYPHLLVMEDVEYPATISSCALFIKKELITNIRYIEKVRFSEDWLFGCQLMLNARSFYYMKNQTFYHYRMNEKSVTHNYNPGKWSDYKKLYSNMEIVFKNYHDFNFNDQLNLVFLFLIFNAIGDVYGVSSLTSREKVHVIKEILKDDKTKNVLKNIKINSLNISNKQKIITWCYKHKICIYSLIYYFKFKRRRML